MRGSLSDEQADGASRECGGEGTSYLYFAVQNGQARLEYDGDLDALSAGICEFLATSQRSRR